MTKSEAGSIFSAAYRATTSGVVLLMTLLAFEAMAVPAALPTATRDLHAIGAIGWAFTGFLAASLIGMVASGQICDQRGPRRAVFAGLAAFLVGLTLSGSSSTIEQFVAGRCVQGLGAGLLITAMYVVLGVAYPARLRPKLFAALSSAWVVPSLVGPVVAGALAQHASWRWVFLGLLPPALVGAALIVPVLGRLPDRPHAGDAARSRIGWRRLGRAIAAAAGIAALEAAGQHPKLVAIVPALVGLLALAWGLRLLLPAGTVRVRPGVTAPIALRGLLAGGLFGAESTLPLMLQVQHGYHPTAAALPLAAAGLSWAVGSWWQGRLHPDGDSEQRVVLIRIGFALVAVAVAIVAVTAHPAVPGWLAYPAWSIAGLGAGLVMPSLGVLLLHYTTDARRGGDSAALQLADSTCSAITTGIAGVLVAAAVHGHIGYTTAFTTLDVAMIAMALCGVAVCGRAAPSRTLRLSGQAVSQG